MADYTMAFKDYITAMGGEIVTSDFGTTLNNSQLVGLGDYPIYQPSERSRLNGLIVDEFMNREIGVETPSVFRGRLRSRMHQIMRMYNRFYEADLLKFDPLSTMDIVTEMNAQNESLMRGTVRSDASNDQTERTEAEAESNGSSHSTTATKSRGVSSDFPQTMLSGSEDYARSGSDSSGTSTADGTTNEKSESASDRTTSGTSVQEGEQSAENTDTTTQRSRTHGYQGSAGDLLIRFRESAISTDQLILQDLDILFMQTFKTDEVDTGVWPFTHYYRRW